MILSAAVLPDSPPVVTRDFDGWRVSLVRGGRVHTYLCETQREAERFAALLAKPLTQTQNSLRGDTSPNSSDLPGSKAKW